MQKKLIKEIGQERKLLHHIVIINLFMLKATLNVDINIMRIHHIIHGSLIHYLTLFIMGQLNVVEVHDIIVIHLPFGMVLKDIEIYVQLQDYVVCIIPPQLYIYLDLIYKIKVSIKKLL